MSRLERFTLWMFRHRTPLVAVFTALTMIMGWYAAHVRVDASFHKSLPLDHPYIRTYLKHERQFGGANRVIVDAGAHVSGPITIRGANNTVHFGAGSRWIGAIAVKGSDQRFVFGDRSTSVSCRVLVQEGFMPQAVMTDPSPRFAFYVFTA